MIPNLRGLAGRGDVLRVDGNYLYQVGSQIHPLSEFKADTGVGGKFTTYNDAFLPLLFAEASLEPLIHRSVFRLRTSVQAGNALSSAIKALKAKIDSLKADERSQGLDFIEAYSVTNSLTAFEAVLGAELALIPLYVVTQKAGFDTAILIDAGTVCFPEDIWKKAPECASDLAQGTRCIAFELPTAAGFHLHRANEAVLRRYWDAVANGAPRPTSRNMGDYLVGMDKGSFGDPKVKAALRHLKDFHRNPLVHPEHTIQSTDEAIALMNSIHTVIVNMLREIPEIAPLAAQAAAGAGVVIPPASPSAAPA